MKKIASLLLTFAILLSLCACSSGANTSSTEKVIGESKKFSQSEIESAVELVLKKGFSKDSGVKSFDKIWYDEEESNKEVASYHATKDDADNAIVLFTDFTTGDNTMSLNPSDKYTGYMWIIKRNNKNAAWEIIDCGY